MDLPPELLDYESRSDRLARFSAGIDTLLREALGTDWLHAKPDEEDKVLTLRQRDWRELLYFYQASIVNSGDLFGYLSVVYDRRELFEQINATKTLAAADELKGLYDEYLDLPTDEQKGDFWHRTQSQREPIEQKAEGLCEFADLLIRFAESYPQEFREMEPEDPFDRVSEVIDSLRQKADAVGHDMSDLDSVEELLGNLRSSLFDEGDTNTPP